MSARHRIFIPLLGDSAALRDVDATAAGDGRFRIDMSAGAAAAGFSIGAVVFGYCSVRWGDSAWHGLINLLGD